MEYGRLYDSNIDESGQELYTFDQVRLVVRMSKDVLLFSDSF